MSYSFIISYAGCYSKLDYNLNIQTKYISGNFHAFANMYENNRNAHRDETVFSVEVCFKFFLVKNYDHLVRISHMVGYNINLK